MNAAARALAQYYYFDRPLRIFLHAPWRLACLILLMSVVLSAMALLYTRATGQHYTAALSALQQQEQYLQAQHKQLLLERGAWANPMRLQTLAEERLLMVLPNERSLKTVN
jgi:cell division protein FtsL